MRRILHRYNKFGFEELHDRKHNTTHTILSDNELFDIDKALSKCPRRYTYTIEGNLGIKIRVGAN